MKVFFNEKANHQSTLNEVMIDGHAIGYSCLMKPTNAHKPPVVFLAGLFEDDKDSHKRREKLALDHPVFVIHLPGLGESMVDGASLSYEDYAVLLTLFLDHMGVTKCHIIAHTYAANIALKFIHKDEKIIESFIAIAPILKVRDSVQYLLEENLSLLDKGNVKSFAAQTTLHQITTFSHNHTVKNVLMNHYLNLIQSDELLLAKYKAHTQRLLDYAKIETTRNTLQCCRICIIAGSNDLTTTPAEAFKLNNECHKSTFILMNEGDQMMNHEKGDVLFRLYKRWVEGKSLKRMKDIKVIDANELAQKYIRTSPRIDIGEEAFLLADNGDKVAVTLDSLTAFGCQLSSDTVLPKQFSRSGKLIFPFKDLVLNLGLFPIDFLSSGKSSFYRGIFSHESFENHEKLQSYLFEFSMKNHVKLVS
jgi:pimeloyl-ACP methyl ester carboxylesterase